MDLFVIQNSCVKSRFLVGDDSQDMSARSLEDAHPQSTCVCVHMSECVHMGECIDIFFFRKDQHFYGIYVITYDFS